MKQYRLREIPKFMVGSGECVRYAQYILGPERGNHWNMSLDAVSLKAHCHTDAHIHEQLSEIMLFVNAGILSIDGQSYQVEQNTVAVILPGESHMVINDSDEELTWFCIFAPAWEKSEEVRSFIEQNPI